MERTKRPRKRLGDMEIIITPAEKAAAIARMKAQLAARKAGKKS